MVIDKVANFQSPSTIVQKALHVIKPAKSMGKVLGQGTTKTLKPGGLGKLPSLKNPVSATGTTKGFNSGNSGLNITKAAHENGNGEQMNSNILGIAYTAGVNAALEKLAMPMPPQMPMGQVQEQMQPGMMQQQAPMQQMQPQQAPPMEAPVAAPMQEVQQNMAAQASPEELQDVQNSGITSGDIASAAKVIQTMAEMKATADMAGMQPVDQSGVQAPGMGAPAPQG